ncbi:hypothetical protein, partial [Chitinophaga sp.]|uniref:type IX secretion system periplasmic lipoprotein PorW/SprE n=1 Tax=Chitinophaga sp. TaxID=1869181 RepID=UPI002F949B98
SYILGQLYILQHRPDSALEQFRNVIGMKPDPMMDFQARLQIAKTNAETTGDIAKSIAGLHHMLRKQRFSRFRDGIYYTMGTLVYPKDPDAAIGYMKQSLKVPSDNLMQRTLTYKGIADIYYDQRNYPDAKKYYDSTAGVMTKDYMDAATVNVRKEVLSEVVTKLDLIHREDSLQKIAAMSPSDRNILLSKMAAVIKTEATDKKIKEAMAAANPLDASAMGMTGGGAYGPKEEKGDWYFYNASSKSAGYSEFKRRWGNRQPGDNWRRSQNGVVNAANSNAPIEIEEGTSTTIKVMSPDSVTAESLAAGLPLSPEKLAASEKLVKDAWFDLGKLYHDKLENFPLAIETYDSLLILFPDHPRKPEVLYSLYIWNSKMNHTAAANQYKAMVLNQYGNTNFADIIRSGGLNNDADVAKKKQISAAYDSAYTAFQNGNYAEAMAIKQRADTAFGFNFLKPRFDLLEAMLIVKTDTLFATDSSQLSRKAVQNVLTKYAADEPIRLQAQALMDALEHRGELTNYLAKLEVRKKDANGQLLDENITMRYPWQNPQPVLADRVNTATARTDSSKIAAGMVTPLPAPIVPVAPPKPVTPYKVNADNPFFVVLSFDRVSKELMDEGLNQFTRYNATKHAADKIEVGSFVLTPNDVMLIFRIFPNEDKALEYFDEIRDAAAASIIPRIRPTEYNFFVISRDNFILLNSTKDLTGYRKFFTETYVTQ